jgi:hypothetical protein
MGLGMTPAWSTTSLARVGEDGGTQRGLTVVWNDDVEALRKTRRWHELRGGRRRRGLQGNF